MSTGAVLVVVTFVEVGMRLAEPPGPGAAFVTGAVTSLPFALVLVAGGYRVAGDVRPEYYSRVAGGTIAGLTFFVVFLGVVAVSIFDSLLAQIEVLRWAASIGAGGGFLVSYLHARSVQQEVTAERATVRAEEAERRQELLEYLNGLLRHEVLNTATAIDGHASLAAGATDDGTVRDHLEVVRRQTDELTRVIDDVRVLLEATADRDTSAAVDLEGVVRDELRKLRDRHPSAEVETDLPDGAYLLADDLVRRLFSNLFENAVEHNGNPTPRVSVTATCSPDTVTVRVEDDGPGFDADEFEGVLEPTPTLETNHGLGLVIVSRLAERYGGSLELEETGPEGSVVAVELPRADEPAEVDDAAPEAGG